jgi:hypothetical protein
LTLERQARPRTARVKRQRKNSSANNKLAVTVDTVGAFPKIIVMELPNVNIPKTVNHPSIVFAPPGQHRRRPLFVLSLFALDKIQPPNGAGESQVLRQVECQLEA